MSSQKIFRVTQRRFAENIESLLCGKGGLYASGRWHAQGALVTYFSSSRALCLLELLAHLSIHPRDSQWPLVAVELEIPREFIQPENIRFISRSELDSLDRNWRIPDSALCNKIGNLWYNDCEHLVLKVPSAIVPEEFNFVLNSRHPEMAKIITESVFSVSAIEIDQRIAEILDVQALSKRRQT